MDGVGEKENVCPRPRVRTIHKLYAKLSTVIRTQCCPFLLLGRANDESKLLPCLTLALDSFAIDSSLHTLGEADTQAGTTTSFPPRAADTPAYFGFRRKKE
jgi:hypothetical protein